MALTKITKTGITDSAVDNNKIEADAVDATKIADNAISEEHLDETVITGNTELSASAASDDVLLIYDTSSGTIKKIQSSNVGLQAPTISSVSPTSVLSGDGTGNYTFTITGTGYITGTTAKLINTSGTDVNFDTVTRDSATQITGVIAKSSLGTVGEPYDVRVTTPNGIFATLEDQINVDQSPVFVTSAGSLGSIADESRTGVSLSVNATDPDSAGNVTFELQSGSLPPGLSLTNTAAEGGTAIISGNATAAIADTTYNFTLRAVDAASNTSSRSFSITILAPTVAVFNASGTFSVPSGTTSVDVLVVAGGASGGGGRNSLDAQNGGSGGGGAGGLIFYPEYPVTPGGTITVTVGCGGAPQSSDQSRGNDGQDSVFGTITAKGGGGGGATSCSQPVYDGQSGGSGGGGADTGTSSSNSSGGSATQPTQPGNSGAYGFGNPGGGVQGGGGNFGGAGGGGAGVAGTTNGGDSNGRPGGNGKAYTIADGTTSVYYAGGGGGAGGGGADPSGVGGQGGGGAGAVVNGSAAVSGQANKGGGGGGGTEPLSPSGGGGKGIVIVRYL